MRRFAILAICALALLGATSPASAQSEMQNQQFADKLVHQLLGVKAGNVVVINMGPNQEELAEDIATSVGAAGGFPILNFGSNRLGKMYFDQVPSRFASVTPKSTMDLVRIADAMITIDLPNDPSVIAGVPASRLAALTTAGNPITSLILKRSVPSIDIGNGLMPSASSAAQYGVGPDVLSTLFWSGVNADYAQIATDANAVNAMVGGAQRVRITAPNGTDFSFSAQPRAAVINTGVISSGDRARGGAAVQRFLPAGDVYFLPVSGSANGTIVFGDFRYNGTLVSGLRAHFVADKVTSMSATAGESAVREQYDVGGAGRDDFAFADFGTNRSMHVPSSGQWGPGPSMAAGYVTAGFGSNLFFGGTDSSSFAWSSNIPNATVTVNGKRLIGAGELAQLQ